MAIFESLFDIMYLVFVIGLGIQLVLQNNKTARLFGWMGIVLGAGDSFHLMPRIISHWSPVGFAGNAVLLSWGKMITSVTMTLFYLMYYFFLKRQSGENKKLKDYVIYFLVLARVILVLLPQNNWGSLEESYLFSLIRNIPFALMGILLIIWTYPHRNKTGLKYMSLLISLSFIFYAPVVLWSHKIPALGALMMPKTVAYFLIVYLGYKNFMPKFNERQIAELSFVYLIFGLLAGVFYREFTKLYAFTGRTSLNIIHSHLLSFGFIGFMLIFVALYVLKEENPDLIKRIKKFINIWNFGLVMTVAMFLMKGIANTLGSNYSKAIASAISGLSGIGHTLLAVGLVMSFMMIVKAKFKE